MGLAEDIIMTAGRIPPLTQGVDKLKTPAPAPSVPLGQGGMDPMMDRAVGSKPYRGCCGS